MPHDFSTKTYKKWPLGLGILGVWNHGDSRELFCDDFGQVHSSRFFCVRPKGIEEVSRLNKHQKETSHYSIDRIKMIVKS